MDWIIILAIALLSVVLFCHRRRTWRSLSDRAQQRRGLRLLVQATVALWAALLIVHRGFASPDGVSFGINLRSQTALGIALILVLAGCLWSIRGGRLLRRGRRMFQTW